jgi:hypothetical protein
MVELLERRHVREVNWAMAIILPTLGVVGLAIWAVQQVLP